MKNTLKNARKPPLLLLISPAGNGKLCIVNFRRTILYNIITIMLYFYASDQKSELLYLALMLFPCGYRVDTCRIDAGVSEDIRELRDILLHIIIGPREQVAQVMRKDLSRLHACFLTQFFHFLPDIAPVPGPAS